MWLSPCLVSCSESLEIVYFRWYAIEKGFHSQKAKHIRVLSSHDIFYHL
ncbi:hypothetical protein ACHAXS_003759, partial [Conticribra weissflogii]